MKNSHRTRAVRLALSFALVGAACQSEDGPGNTGGGEETDGAGAGNHAGEETGTQGGSQSAAGGTFGASGDGGAAGVGVSGSAGQGDGGALGPNGGAGGTAGDAGAAGASGSGGTANSSRPCGSPTLATLNEGQTFDNSNGHLNGSTKLLDLGASGSPIFRSGDRVLSMNLSGENSPNATAGWSLWDVPSGERIATGSGALLDRKGPIFLVRVGYVDSTLEVRAVSDGQLLGALSGEHSYADPELAGPSPAQGSCGSPPCTFVGLAHDGSYVWTRNPAGALKTWLPNGAPSYAFSGDYRSVGFPQISASSSRLAVAAGPAGPNVVEYLNMANGAQTTSAVFAGTFRFWFADGSHFLTLAGNQINRFYAPDASLVSTINLPDKSPSWGFGDYFWRKREGLPGADIYRLDADPNNPMPALSTPTGSPALAGHLLVVTSQGLLTVVNLDDELNTETVVVPIAGYPVGDDVGHLAIVGAYGVLYYRGTVASASASGFLGCGFASAVAGSESGTAVVATRSGKVLVIDTATQSVSEVLEPFLSTHLELSADGSVLVGNGNPNDLYNGQLDLDAYTLPGGLLSKRWNSPVSDFRLSRNGTRLSRACSNQVTDLSGANPISLVATTQCSPPRLSPSGANIATSSRDPYLDEPDPLKPPTTTIYNGATLADIVPGHALGWIDDHRLVVQSYSIVGASPNNPAAWIYLDTKLYDDQAQLIGTLPALPNMSDFYVVSPSQIMSMDDANIYDLTTGATVFTSGAPPRCRATVSVPDPCSTTGFAPPSYALAGTSIVQAHGPGVFLATP